MLLINLIGCFISIHAPPRGATFLFRGRFRPFAFQFTPLREGRPHCMDTMFSINHFNSRPSARGDLHPQRAECVRCISIHAPPRGATPSASRARLAGVNFNSRPSARGDPLTLLPSVDMVFQFTPLREGRLLSGVLFCTAPYFNSRPSARGDTSGSQGHRGRCYFNSRPSARGDSKRYAISANLLFNPYKSAWLNNRATQFVEIILVIFHRIIA